MRLIHLHLLEKGDPEIPGFGKYLEDDYNLP